MQRNIELKARCPDLASARDAAERLGATFGGILEQRDTYFIVPHGRLKLRETAGGTAELIAYARDDLAAVRGSDYQLVSIPDPAELRAALSRSLGVRGEVIKRRELWLWQGVRIHLDEVERLGTFLEFEAVMADGEADEAGRVKVAVLREALNVRDEDLIGVSYSDLLGI